MTPYVIDASVVLKWFAPAVELHTEEAIEVLQMYVAKELSLVVPPVLELEVVNVAARRWRFSLSDLRGAAADLRQLELEVHTPRLNAVVQWAGQGLTAYDASYVAVADEIGAPLITADDAILAAASSIARAPEDWPHPRRG